MLSITCFSCALLIFVRETNAEYSQKVSICGFDINMCFNQSLPFFDHWPKFISGQIHAMEVGQHIATLNIFSDESEFSEGPLCIVVTLKISKWNFKYSEFQTLRSDLCRNKFILKINNFSNLFTTNIYKI